ncbi:MAG: ctaD [Solirubrobacterales bacterium]|nr:ctaD [Solirubrobacterales bacterium]
MIHTPNVGADAWIMGLVVSGLGTILGAVNIITTILTLRAPGLTMFRMSVFTWNILFTALMVIMAFPVLTAALLVLEADRRLGAHVFSSSVAGPMLWQHLFWFFGHPEVYIMVLPGFGVISEVLPVFARKPIFGYKAIAASTVAIAFLGFLTWAHHMFTAPIPEGILVFVMLSSYFIAVPTGVKVLNWVATLWRGSIEFRTPLLFCVGAIAIFLIGGISGIFLATFPIDWQVNETYFVVAHLHFVLLGGAVMPIFAAIYYWFPKMTGRMLSEGLGRLSCALIFLGILTTFLIQHVMGLDGMPRRVYEYDTVGHLQLYNVISTIGSFILAAGVAATVVNVVLSLRKGTVAGPDPWQANTLEWFTASPPPANNFDVVPLVRSAEPMKDIRREVARRSGGDASPSGATVPAGARQVGV